MQLWISTPGGSSVMKSATDRRSQGVDGNLLPSLMRMAFGYPRGTFILSWSTVQPDRVDFIPNYFEGITYVFHLWHRKRDRFSVAVSRLVYVYRRFTTK